MIKNLGIKFIVFLFVMVIIQISFANNYNNKLTIAVYGFSSTNLKPEEFKGLEIIFEDELFKTGYFEIFERSKLNKILEELNLSKNEMFSADKAVELGQLLGIRYVAYGYIIEFYKKWIISIKIVDVASGKVNYESTKVINNSENINKNLIKSLLSDLVNYNNEIKLAQFGINSVKVIQESSNKKIIKMELIIEAKFGYEGPVYFKIDSFNENNVPKWVNIEPKEFNLTKGENIIKVNINLEELDGYNNYRLLLKLYTDYTNKGIFLNYKQNGMIEVQILDN